MENFTLEAAKNGVPLVTRDGRPARFVAVLDPAKCNPQFPVLVEVFQYTEEETREKFKGTPGMFGTFYKKVLKENENWYLENYSPDGDFLPPFESEWDLFLNRL